MPRYYHYYLAATRNRKFDCRFIMATTFTIFNLGPSRLLSTHCLFHSWHHRGKLNACEVSSESVFNIGSVLPSAPIRSTEFNPPPLSLRRFTSASTLPFGLLRLHRIREVLHNGFPRVHRLLPERVVYLIYHASRRPVVCTLT